MAKKKRKKRRPDRPRSDQATPRPQPAEAGTGPGRTGARQERKELARRERERRMRRARRRHRLRRGFRWGAVLGVAAAVVAFIVLQTRAGRQLEEEAQAAAERLACTDIRSFPEEGQEHIDPGQPLPEYRTTPATSGPHNPAPLPPQPSVYQQQMPEDQAVHNLEHAYVLIYYRADGDGALAEPVVRALEDVAESEGKVLMSPYPDLAEGTSVALAAWTKLLECPEVGPEGTDDLLVVTRAFIQQFRGTDNAPEPAGG